MLKKDIILKKHIDLNEKFDLKNDQSICRDLIKAIDFINVKGTIDYQENIKAINVKAKITTSFWAIDARDGCEFYLENQCYDWNDQYFFENITNDQHNYVLEDQFCIKDYAIEQIFLNIPINLTKNNGIISFVGKDYVIMTEDEYQNEQSNQIDPRWEKLKEFDFNKK